MLQIRFYYHNIYNNIPSFTVELIKLNALLAEQQHYLKQYDSKKAVDTKDNTDVDIIAELRTALEIERAGSAKLEQALAAALADNAALATSLHAADNSSSNIKNDSPPTSVTYTNICQIDSFLAD